MTRKDYILITAALRDTRSASLAQPTPQRKIVDLVCENIADALASNNPRFDRDRFLLACGVGLE